MRLLLLVFCSLALATQIVAQRLPDVRGNLHTLPFGKLTQFWAHQAAGIPEGHAFIRELEQQNFNFATPQLGVLDSGFSTTSLLAGIRLTPQLHQHLSNSEVDPSDSFADVFAQAFPNPLRDFLLQLYARRPPKQRHLRHGSAVAYVLASNTSASVSVRGDIAWLLPRPRRYTLDDFAKLIEMIVALPLPQVINLSMAFGGGEDWSKGVSTAIEMLATRTLFVTSAGNNAPDPIEAGKRELAEPLVIVGSTDPTGHVSSFSQACCAETIRACSDEYLQSINHKSGELFNFGGTSGAAPMVSAALADVLSILPDLSRKHAELLLRNTALANSYDDGAGLLNYFKLLRVVHRLAERGWSSTSGAEAVLHDPSLYDFHAEAEQLTQAAIASISNDEAFLKLRQAFFLDHTNHVARKLLAETYRQHGYEAQAFFYDNHDKEARDAFIAQKDKEQHETVNKFFAAIAKADTDTMLQLLPYLSKKLFLRNKSFKFHDDLRALSREKQALVINFLQEHKIAKVIIYADGNISVSTIRDD